MAETRKVLGQLSPAATTLSTLYTVPGATQAVASSFVVCNRGTTNSTFRLSVAIAGAADDNKQYVYYDVAIQGNDTFIATIGLALGAADVIRVYSSSTDLSFSLHGVEIT
jgi:hypothetical protein